MFAWWQWLGASVFKHDILCVCTIKEALARKQHQLRLSSLCQPSVSTTIHHRRSECESVAGFAPVKVEASKCADTFLWISTGAHNCNFIPKAFQCVWATACRIHKVFNIFKHFQHFLNQTQQEEPPPPPPLQIRPKLSLSFIFLQQCGIQGFSRWEKEYFGKTDHCI